MVREAQARLTMRGSFSCGRAVDERDVALTQATVLWRVNSDAVRAKACGASPFHPTVSSIQEYPMATSAAVKEAPATIFAKDQLKAITAPVERDHGRKKTTDPHARAVAG